MNKTQRRKERLEKHYSTLERLSDVLWHRQDGKKLSSKLFKLEQQAYKAATDYCNGDNGMTCDKWELFTIEMEKKLQEVFECKVPGLLINGDARGYALKIDSELMHLYETVGLVRDLGGNGILSPDINGEA